MTLYEGKCRTFCVAFWCIIGKEAIDRMDFNANKNIIKRSVVIRNAFVFFGFGIIVIALLYYQVYKHDFYKTKAISQQTLDTEITAKSGTIYDRNYAEIAVSTDTETISLCPAEIKEGKEKLIAEKLAEILELDYEDVYEKACSDTQYQRVKRQVDVVTADKVRAFIEEEKVTGIHFTEDSKRYYPYGSLASKIIGFRGSDNQGLYGIEKMYDSYLTGSNGKLITAKNAKGDELPVQYETYVEAVDGQDVVLTIDRVVQQYLEKHLEVALEENKASSAAGIVIDVNTAEILGMAVKPDFDLNQPYTISEEVSAQWADLTEEERKTQRNNYLTSLWSNSLVNLTYEPGSTFKIVTAAMALEEGVVTPDTTGFNCSGSTVVADTRISCWQHAGHGSQNFLKAMQNSCNPAFIKVGSMVGNQTFLKYVDAFGFQEKTGVDLLGEASGLFHDPDRFNQVELATSSFGQTFKVTPLEMLNAVCAVANGGNLMKPHIVKQITQTDEDGNVKVIKNISPTVIRQVISKETSETLCGMLEQVVANGSGKNAYVKGYHVAGKTGTSEKTDQTVAEGEAEPYIASFIGFAPADDPQIAILIMIDEPSAGEYFGGLIAAPVAGDVLRDVLPYLEIQPEYTEEELATVDQVVPNCLGKDSADAIRQLQSNNFEYEIVGGEGKIETQSPAAGDQIPQGGKVVLYTNGEKPSDSCMVPDLTDLTLSSAKNELASQGLNIRVNGNAKSGSVVFQQDPAAGTLVSEGTVVTVKLKSYSGVSN